MFRAGFLSPSTGLEFGRKNREVFEVKSHSEIDVPCESPEVTEAEEGSSPDDRDGRGIRFGNNVQLREIVHLLIGQHITKLGTCCEILGLPREHGDLCCSTVLHR